ncbi:MAG: MFS transporter [Candidatus Eremiobacteraeota bacterium]|nr:MFS transporter [Candidatus Eremiobacteraeota bacterium]
MSSGSARWRQFGSWTLLNALWIPLTFQDAALMTIAVPSALIAIAPASHVVVLSILVSVVNFAAMLVQPVAGYLSDHLRRGGGQRRAFVAAAIAIDVAALFALAFMHSLAGFSICLVIAVVGANIGLAAYQALLPELVPRTQWGAVSGVRGGLTLIGTALGLATAGNAPNPSVTFVCAAILLALCATSLLGVREVEWTEPEHAHVRDWHDFTIVFAARALVFFGLTLLQTYVLYYFGDIQKLPDPTVGTMIAGFCSMIGATASSVYLGILSDRAPRKIVTAIAGIPMALAAIGFAIAPAPQWIFLYAFLFGIGFGGVFSSGWALAMDSIPAMRDVARDLGLWGIATNLPSVLAPLVGGPLIAAFHGTRDGYQAVFGLAGFCFVLASLTVLRVGRSPLSSMWGWPLRFAAYFSTYVGNHWFYRIRAFGKMPRRRGATVILANHQHDLEGQAIVGDTATRFGPWRHPIYMVNSRRMFEPGFLAVRLPLVRSLLRNFNAAPLFGALGMMPLENDLGSREISALAWSIQRRHGALALSEIFDQKVAASFAPGTKTSDLLLAENFEKAHAVVKLSALRDPYRKEIFEETRAHIGEDLDAMERVVRRGATFYMSPEGHYSVDGRIGPIKGVYDRLAPHATIYLAGVSYDPFVSKRLSMLYRIQRLDDRDHLRETLAAIRPVTASQLLGAWLESRTQPFTVEDVVDGVRERLRALPSELFVDPELRNDPAGKVRRALPLMAGWGILNRQNGSYILAQTRRHPEFPKVKDIVAYQARFLEETIANARYSVITSDV